MDKGIGQVLKALKDSGKEANTLVVFLSDNGASNKKLDEKSIEIRNPMNLRGQKASVWENGIRVPLLIRYPSKVAIGERQDFVMVEDLMPTILDFCSISFSPKTPPSETGISIKKNLTNSVPLPLDREALRMAISGKGSPTAKVGVAPTLESLSFENMHLTLRGASYKLHSLPIGEKELYDIQKDPSESNNIIKDFPEIALQMEQRLRDRWEKLLQVLESGDLVPHSSK